MNTYRIYEDLRLALGEEAAKSLAHTLGPMFEEVGDMVTKSEFRQLDATVGRLAEAQERTEEKVTRLAEAQERTEERVARLAEAQERTEERVTRLAEAQERTEEKVARLAEAQERTEEKVARLAEAQERTEEKVARLAEAQERTEERVTRLAEAQERLAAAQDRTEVQVAELTKAQARTEHQLADLTEVVRSLAATTERQGIRLDGVIGRTFEMQFRDRLTSYLGRLMRRGKLLRNDEVLDAIEQSIDEYEADEVLRADAIATGMIDGVASHVVVEVSATCDTDDIVRAERRAGILRKAGLVAVPLVACEFISAESLDYARSRQVRVWCNGMILDAAA